MTPSEALESTGRSYPGVRLFEGQKQELLAEMAIGHALYMARVGRQGHQGWPQRYATIRRELNLGAAEICAQSWSWQADDPLEAIAAEMFHSWEQSPGHWRVASSPHAWWGCGMARSRRGIWYASIIVGD